MISQSVDSSYYREKNYFVSWNALLEHPKKALVLGKKSSSVTNGREQWMNRRRKAYGGRQEWRKKGKGGSKDFETRFFSIQL